MLADRDLDSTSLPSHLNGKLLEGRVPVSLFPRYPRDGQQHKLSYIEYLLSDGAALGNHR